MGSLRRPHRATYLKRLPSVSPSYSVTREPADRPASTADVSAVLAAADDRGVPVTPYAAGTSIFVEYHANHGVDEEVAFVETVVEVHDVETFEIAGDDRMAEIRRARDELAFAVQRYDPDLEPRHPGDVTVSISRYPDIVRYAEKLADERGLPLPCLATLATITSTTRR